jgi:hypothetical protein
MQDALVSILPVALLLATAAVATPAGQDLRIGIVDVYGLRSVSEASVRAALTFREGDAVALDGDAPPAFVTASEQRLARLPGVADARVSVVCCHEGRAIVYVGIHEAGAPGLQFRDAPRGEDRLPADVVAAGAELSDAVMAAAQRGAVAEDDSQGHAFFSDPRARAVQERYIAYARQHFDVLRAVLRTSADASQRALAAEILGYAPDKSRVVDDLVYGMNDPAGPVRNAAMRALMAFTRATAPDAPRVRVPGLPFVAMLGSPVWTDRNKASLALMEITAAREPRLLAVLRRDALEHLVDMARWTAEGHAIPALIILGRIAGRPDAAILDSHKRGDREEIIRAALAVRAGPAW